MSDLGTTTFTDSAEDNATAADAGANVQVNTQVDAHSIRARQNARDQISSDVDAYLNGGGNIETLEPNLRIDLPRKPQNNYGKGSL